ALGIPKPTLSFHLKELSTAGLIDSEKTGRSIKYRLQSKRMSQLMAFLTEDCCQGRPELCCPTKPSIS
ncbi:helix-turn-helix domain-containing protein, partial [Akkermansiaceae bacterium]|nr:helix-turn-helix domain-containing protein [Akkermansiaceae bacterium]